MTSISTSATSFFSSALAGLTGPQPGSHEIPQGEVVNGVIASTLFFFTLRQLSSWLCLALVPQYRALDKQRQGRFDLYVLSLINSAFIGLTSLYKVLLCDTERDLYLNLGMMVFIFGYFIHDFWATRHEWQRYPADAIHHVAAFFVCIGMLGTQLRETVPLVPWFGLVELSTILVDINWIQREFKDDEARTKLVSVLFAVTFFTTRVVIMPYQIFKMSVMSDIFSRHWLMRVLQVALLAAQGLQFYWFRKIVIMIQKPARKEKKK